MGQYLEIHPLNPEHRRIKMAVDVLRNDGVIIYPTDSAYALGCRLGNKAGMQRIIKIRQLDKKHNFTLVCRDLSELATYARVDNTAYRLLKSFTPDAYTFILKATSEVPRLLLHPKRKTIGIRVPDNAIVKALLEELGEPILSSSLILPGADDPLSDVYEIQEQLGHAVDLVLDGGFCGLELTTVVDLVDGVPEILRRGKADPQPFIS